MLLGAYHARIMPEAVNEEGEVQGKLGRVLETQPVRFSVVKGWERGTFFLPAWCSKGRRERDRSDGKRNLIAM